jgi:hypothetical protein
MLYGGVKGSVVIVIHIKRECKKDPGSLKGFLVSGNNSFTVKYDSIMASDQKDTILLQCYPEVSGWREITNFVLIGSEGKCFTHSVPECKGMEEKTVCFLFGLIFIQFRIRLVQMINKTSLVY